MKVVFGSLFVVLSFLSCFFPGWVASYSLPQSRILVPTTSLHLFATEEDESNETVDNFRRRTFLSCCFWSSFAVVTSASTTAHAFDKTFPVEIQAVDTTVPDARQRKVKQIKQQQEKERLAALRVKPWSATVWGMAEWFLSGSRSNPLLTLMANVLYNKEEEDWLRDRNEGLFANVPIALYGVMVIVFFALGAVTDTVVQVTAGPAISLPLAGVSLVGGAALELGRIASGDKGPTREESERANQLDSDFREFVDARLQPGGSCHRQEIVQAFRRYFAKYRSEEGVTDLEVERLIRSWSRTQRGVAMSASGFYSGVQINKEADAFVQR